MRKSRKWCAAVLAVLMTALLVPNAGLAASEPKEQALNGYFFFEARGHEIPAAKAEAAMTGWASKQFGGDVTAKLEKGVSSASPSERIATGQRIQFTMPDGFSSLYEIIVSGDVTGSGKPGLAQLVGVSQVVSGAETEDRRKIAAADIDQNQQFGLSDLVKAAGYLSKPDPNGPVVPEIPVVSPRSSDNIFSQSYARWSYPTYSHLYQNKYDGLTRVEYVDGDVVIEDYSADFVPLMSRTLEPELPLWGGFFAGKKWNYIIVGQTNKEESDAKEVIRVVQYDKNWNRTGSASLRGANTTVPFDAGTVRCAEYGDMLYIRTSHEMYKASDGRNHQANLMMAVRQSDMELTQEFSDIWNLSVGYVSHSFNQFVIVDDRGRIVTLDHGDGGPRSLVLIRYLAAAGEEQFLQPGNAAVEYAEYVTFPGVDGDNETGCSVGGFGETKTGYLAAYNYDGRGGGGKRDIYLGYMDKETGQRQWGLVVGENDTLTPQLVPLSLSDGYMIWTEYKRNPDYTYDTEFKFARYDVEGSLGETMTADANQSDCQPIVWNGSVVWYTTENGAPTFYRLNGSNVETIEICEQ